MSAETTGPKSPLKERWRGDEVCCHLILHVGCGSLVSRQPRGPSPLPPVFLTEAAYAGREH